MGMESAGMPETERPKAVVAVPAVAVRVKSLRAREIGLTGTGQYRTVFANGREQRCIDRFAHCVTPDATILTIIM